MFTRELQNRVDYLFRSGNIPPYPRGGSSGVYINAPVAQFSRGITELMLMLNGNQSKLLWLLISSMDEWNQVHKSRREIGSVYMKTYDSGNFTKDVNKLVEIQAVSIVGSILMVSPFLIIPGIKEPKLKALIQTVWEELVWFKD